jgi:uncharacterized protein
MTIKLKRLSKARKRTAPEWRTVCYKLAEQRAQAEARKAWKAKSTKAIFFDYRWEHVQNVVRLADWLAITLDADREIVAAAAWLHDICKGQPNHGVAGAKEAKKVLERTDFPGPKIPPVVDAISRHVGLYRPPDALPLEPVETAILWDADKLSKLGIQGLAYTLSTNYLRGLSLVQRRRDMAEFTLTVLSRTTLSMNTAPARALAAERYQAMVAVLEAWEREEELFNGS